MGELRFLVTDAARAAFDELRGVHPDETFYGFSLLLAADPAGVRASANTEEGLRRVAERFAANGYGAVESLSANAPGSLRWRTSEWEYRDVGGGHFADVARFVADKVRDADPDEVLPGLVGELVGAVRDLNREDYFGWGPERDGVVVLVETSDPDDLLEYARDVNPATPFARLQAGFGPS